MVAQILPDFGIFNTSRFVAYGFNIDGNLLPQHCLMTLAFVVVLTVYGILLPEITGNCGMSQDLTFRRKVIYIAIVALLLYPLFSAGPAGDRRRSPGGVLAQLRPSTACPRPTWAKSIRPANR